jgi:hypothetical protein
MERTTVLRLGAVNSTMGEEKVDVRRRRIRRRDCG